MCMWFSNFFEHPFVSRVKRRICIRTVRFGRVSVSMGQKSGWEEWTGLADVTR
jgi:hypothetical protein